MVETGGGGGMHETSWIGDQDSSMQGTASKGRKMLILRFSCCLFCTAAVYLGSFSLSICLLLCTFLLAQTSFQLLSTVVSSPPYLSCCPLFCLHL